jgi:predicted esterase YcpF (UPF0227 family)
MENKKHIVIFSHGFGVKKDDRGLLSGEYGIAEELSKYNIDTILFDYNDVNEIENTLTVHKLSEQAEMLNNVIKKVCLENKDAIIDIIGHSQGCLAVALAKPIGIRKIIFLAPSLDKDIEHTINIFKGRPGTEINLSGISKLARNDGTTTLVPALFWGEIKQFDPIFLYNELSYKTDLIIINAKQDEIHDNSNTQELDKKIKILEIDGNHQFSGEARPELINQIKEIIL